MILSRQTCLIVLAACCLACDGTTGNTIEGPAATPTLDVQLRQAIGPWGVVPILPVNAANPALVDLGRMLFFDKILSGNRDVSCASCHSPLSHTGDDRSLAVGTGALISGATRQ